MTSIKRWRRVVFDTELDCLGSSLAGNLGSDSEPKIDAGSNATKVITLPSLTTLAFSWVAPIADRLDDSVASARDTEQVEGRTIRKGVRWHEAQPAIAGTGASDFATMWVAD